MMLVRFFFSVCMLVFALDLYSQEVVFDAKVAAKIQNSNSIAIDLGAGMGSTTAWLSKRFHHVVSVDGDGRSITNLRNTLQTLNRSNVSVCSRPVASTSRDLIIEGRAVQAITIKQLIHDYVYQNEAVRDRNIVFVHCDIEGSEEDILEDLLYFAYYNKVKVHLSFYLDRWETKKIADFRKMFSFFKTNCQHHDICDYLRQNPRASLLFEPQDKSEILLKSEMPTIVIAYNQPTFIKNMVRQLEQYTTDIIVVDNHSTFEPLLDYYKNEYKYTLLRQKRNFGYKIYLEDWIQKLVGDVYLLTDPDLLFNKKLPKDFIQKMVELSNYYQAYKVGFALCIDDPSIRTDITYRGQTIKEWEGSSFWRHPVVYPRDPNLVVYAAAIDTTFCLVNRKNYPPKAFFPTINAPGFFRIAGDFTCYHIPWHKDFQHNLMNGEYEKYLDGNNSTNWFQLHGEKHDW